MMTDGRVVRQVSGWDGMDRARGPTTGAAGGAIQRRPGWLGLLGSGFRAGLGLIDRGSWTGLAKRARKELSERAWTLGELKAVASQRRQRRQPTKPPTIWERAKDSQPA